MNENEKPVIGTSEAAVLTVVELIARAARMSEQHLAYWLDLYYQVRSRHEEVMTPRDISELMVKVEETDPVIEQLDRIEEKVNTIYRRLTRSEGDIEKIRSILAEISGAPRPPAPTEEMEAGVTDNNVGNKSPEVEDPPPVMRGRETIKLQERVKNESRSEAAKKQKAAERQYKIKVADRLRDLRAQGVKTGDIVRVSGGNVTDSAVLTILDGQFRPIADYRALDAALEKCAAEIEKGVTRT